MADERYGALRGCEVGEGRDRQRFEVGDTVPEGVFSKQVVEHWLEKGVLAKEPESKSAARRKAVQRGDR